MSSVLLIGVAIFWSASSGSRAADLLVADRLSNSVYRYSAAGALLGKVVDHSPDLNQPAGIGMSPDFKELYVSSSQNNRVMKYDYNPATGVASNPTIFADASDGLEFPNDIQFSPDGSKIYVANLNGGVSRFNTDGSSAGSKLMLPTSVEGVDTPTSSMIFTSTGQLLAGAFQDASGAGGGIAISNFDVSAIPGYLVEPTPAINGATGLMIHDGYLYVSGLFSFNIRRFSLPVSQTPPDESGPPKAPMDPSWGITGVAFPQDMAVAPDGNGFLLGILGFAGGGGKISRYAFNGTFLNTFAAPSQDGFTEATAFVIVPKPLPGDYNRNGIVDAADYNVWRDNFGTTNLLPNDVTPGMVDASDYDVWRAKFGTSEPVGSGALGANAVPEPTGVLLLFIAILAGSVTRKRA